jgi:hypothetical protein
MDQYKHAIRALNKAAHYAVRAALKEGKPTERLKRIAAETDEVVDND